MKMTTNTCLILAPILCTSGILVFCLMYMYAVTNCVRISFTTHLYNILIEFSCIYTYFLCVFARLDIQTELH